ncbi:hypothetical protein GMLC_06080 [Geomonas limicola]|uniref:FecR protein domain-containing protein n=1 Tax=Geomonas limicola TaxID=2740186 RepID=A0A6V8N6X4_9BACT|nr:hypothetical protein [Geomonas limicola]GFO67029.1 hypothetical protein GMLC_06080 [Geomonas limicola]
MRPRMRIKKFRLVLFEAGGALIMVLALFCLFIVLLYTLFPTGTPLRELFEGSPDPSAEAPGRSVEATLAQLRRDVRFRRGNSIAWTGASDGLKLYSQDAVQTLDNSGALISFGDRDRIAVGSNSLVVVTRLNAQDEAGPRSYRVQVEGEVRGHLSAARKLKLELAAAGHVARLKPGAARFQVVHHDDNSASLTVFSGEVDAVDGAELHVPANHALLLRQGMPAGPARPLPPAPQLVGPQPVRYLYRILPPRIRLAWSGAPGQYRFQLDRTPRFAKPLVDQKLNGTEYRSSRLERGGYYWRVCRVDFGHEGPYSATGRLELEQLLKPPGLSVNFPPEDSVPGPYNFSGTVQPGSRIFVDGGEVAVNQRGSFSYQGVLKAGVNLIRVEALDAAGNASYASRIVYGRM